MKSSNVDNPSQLKQNFYYLPTPNTHYDDEKVTLLLHSVAHCMQLEIPNIPQRRKKIRRTMPQRKRMKTTMKTSSYLMSITTAPVILGSSSLRLAGLIVITGKICYFVLIFKEAFQLRRRSSRSYNVSLSVCAYK